MKAATVEKLVWVLIYGGLLLGGLGLFVDREGSALGIGMVVIGAVAALVGIVLVWVRSRMQSR
jgi:hypothetical protein